MEGQNRGASGPLHACTSQEQHLRCIDSVVRVFRELTLVEAVSGKQEQPQSQSQSQSQSQ